MLRQNVHRGDINENNVEKMALHMKARRIYDENISKVGIVFTFDKILEYWFLQKIFNCKSSEAKKELISVLNNSGTSKRIVSKIEKLCFPEKVS